MYLQMKPLWFPFFPFITSLIECLEIFSFLEASIIEGYTQIKFPFKSYLATFVLTFLARFSIASSEKGGGVKPSSFVA